MHRATRRFWRCLDALPQSVQETAHKSFGLLRMDPAHPSLHFKRVGKLWSARVGISYRALAVEDGEGFVWVWVGSHDDYERLIRQ